MRDAGVVVEGDRIVAVGLGKELREAHPDAAVVELGDAIILPGLVNAHTHLELSLVRRAERVASFVDWILSLLESLREAHADAGYLGHAVEEGVRQCLRFGVTTVGDISAKAQAIRELLSRSPLRAVSYGEVRGMGQRRGQMEGQLAAAAEAVTADRLRIGISPHAPYSTEPTGYRRALELAREENLPLTTHLAESADEAEFLESHSGSFGELWRRLDAWDDQVPRFAGGPIRFASELGLLDYPTLLAHVNYCDDQELGILAKGRASVVYCPRTHAYFGHPPHRFGEMLEAGINVAVGTDSCASSPDLNLVDDLRLVHRLHPDVPAELLFCMITSNAARALQMEDSIGAIAPGYFADLTIFPVGTSEPLVEILESDVLPAQVWIGGEPRFGRYSWRQPCFALLMVATTISWILAGLPMVCQLATGRVSSLGMISIEPTRQSRSRTGETIRVRDFA